MARFDVYLSREGDYLLDCQADVLSNLNTRFRIPLQPPAVAPLAGPRLIPEFDVDGTALCMLTTGY
jgi:toxin CcdB